MSYVAPLRSALLTPLVEKGADGGVEETIALLDEYGLSRDDLFETLAELRLDMGKAGGARGE